MSAPSGRVLFAVVFGLLIGLSSLSAAGQSRPLSEQSQISLITILPGDPIYTFAGHSALRVRDPAQNLDRLYNYGTFNFGDPLFIPKFTYGYLRYHLSVTPYGPMLRFYEQQGRPVIEQRLNLTRAQRSAVYQYLRINARPDNRYYQYDFFFDNCSTRIRDVLTDTLGSTVDFSNVSSPNRSFRELLDPYVASRPLLDLGFDLALGLPADRTATACEIMFLPEHLMQAFEEAHVSAKGQRRPLVTRTDTVQWVSGYDGMTPTWDWPTWLSTGILLLTGGWTIWQGATQQLPRRWGDAVLFAGVGLTGLTICYLWFISTYTVTDNNLNLLWAWPTHLLAASVLLRRPTSRALHLYMGVTAGASLLFALGWPFWPQNFHAAVLPLTLAVGIRAGWWGLLRSSVSIGVLSKESTVAS
ncbi:hypothetical protein BSZ35_17675 [Salinibacter sp. 10B]|uniref:lipoprotein N-acyltransferase Lnb domain-containing protein n=1 Tax=Salinibacter sp. 10B TaxID=1923971 RepID=UPI000CF44BF1|nr:DUF4105 domain-containing protein [Salinibacter sp. 10B]PQJ36185.1 hypothetical protein BSZ35_17675 [Salinibacter sp. 10B]